LSSQHLDYPKDMQATLVPVEEYLRTNYDPDCEYVDGQLVERNLGEKTHSTIQGEILYYLRGRAKELSIQVLPEQRVQVRVNRFRIPDVTVLRLPQPQEQIVTTPPFICIEVLSKDDTMQYMQEKIDDYLRFRVPYIWIVNPRNKKGYVVTQAGMVEAVSGVLETKDPAISMPLSILFE
jgi:Uma2 family endonuclease